MADNGEENACELCGICCTRYQGIHWAQGEDLVRWFDAGRIDILRHCRLTDRQGKWVSGADLTREDLRGITWCEGWLEPGSGAIRSTCPFLKKEGMLRQICSIHAVRPAICRNFCPWDWVNAPNIDIPCPALRKMQNGRSTWF